MIRIPRRPDIEATRVHEIIRERWGVEGQLQPLSGERDRNFLLRTAEAGSFVVKVTSPDEPEDTLAFETRLLAWLAEQAEAPSVPGVVASSAGALVELLESEGGAPLRVRVLRHLSGRTLASSHPHTPELLRELGSRLARLDRVLEAYSEAAPERPDFDWALASAGGVMARARAALPEGRPTELIDRVLRDFEDVEAGLSGLPAQLIHADGNDHNVLVAPDADGEMHVTGLLDLGDAHVAPRVFEPAIAAAYALLDKDDPVGAAAAVVAGYHEERSLSGEELDVVLPLVRARLGASVCIAAWRRHQAADLDDYLTVSEAPAWEAIERLDEVDPHLARARFREACRYAACPRSEELVRWLEGRRGTFAPVVDLPDDPGRICVLDLSVGSADLTGRDTDDTADFTRRTWATMERVGATVGVGRYDEPRAFYLSDAFRGGGGEWPERRTIHLGIDVFVEPGAPVRAPLDATVLSVRDNGDRLDYGPTVILEHPGPDGSFWTLYGHLERASVAELEAGSRLAAGAPFARVGPYPENGDWPPHLHFQIITDLLGKEGDFPEVASPSQRRVWTSLSPDPNLILGLPAETTYRDPEGLEERRARLLGPSLSVSYRTPIHVVRGRGAALFDDLGREYLDCVNNVAHVGHEHPRVVEAGQRQMALLNTNTRYLHRAVLDYAERLANMLPDPLEVCFFVNSGSEANELALRMARAHTGGRGVVALEGGYHGNTQGLVDVSHYKHSGPGGRGAPPWVRTACMPDDFRGRYGRGDPDRAEKFAGHVGEAFSELGRNGYAAAAFLAEPILSCGGQIEPPPGYLTAAYREAREAGALCIADEVQIGFGRVGDAFWGFSLQDVVPDIVTLGKPMGNGHPLGAVVTTREIAASFADGMEFFSTFGGNPVSAVIGLAVLDAIEDEGLQAHAREVGGALKHGLTGLTARHPVVGDVRGRGLFLGVELVRDRETLEPAAELATYLVERARRRGILLSTDGPDHNVIKIKPPLPFSRMDARRVVEELDGILGEDRVRYGR